MPKYLEREVPHNQLLLDPNNYRFRDDPEYRSVPERRLAEAGVQRRAQARLREESLLDLKRSILANGFLPVERIVTRKYPHAKDSYLVLEGNRRLAALKWIAEDHEAGVEIPENVLATLDQIPILILEQEGKEPGVYEAIMGIRHVSGIKEWGGYQRAQLITSLRDQYELEAPVVAERLGMSVREVNRRYKAYKALQQMGENDEVAEHAVAQLYPLFHEAVALPNIRQWLGWDEDTACFTDQANLDLFYEWITPHDEDGEKVDPKITSHRNVRDLPAIVADPEALTVLKDPSTNFTDAATIAKREQIAKAWKGQVAGATSALKSISAIELSHLAESDLEILKELKQAVDTTLSSYEKLSR